MKPSTAKQVKALRTLRAEVDDRIGNRADIVGSMVGLKFKGGELTNQLGITYFVREKFPKSDLPPRKRVPATVKIGDSIVVTDVMVWPRMVEQSFVLPDATIIYDQRKQGTLTCFAQNAIGFYGVSCAHCLAGFDGNPATPTQVDAFSVVVQNWIPVGTSTYMVYSPGPGIRGNFGYLDCGIFDLSQTSLTERAAKGNKLQVVNDLGSIVGQTLVGMSTINTPAPTKWRRAKVAAVESNALGERCDVILAIESPGTFGGDSGMLWLTKDGRAAAIHARGKMMPAMQGSLLTTAMSAKRVCISLGVQLIMG